MKFSGFSTLGSIAILFLSILFLTPSIIFAQDAKTKDAYSIHPSKSIEVNGLNYQYIEKGVGETIFFLHGFPDLANTWDYTISELSKEYRCIAPYLRGYSPTDVSADGDYSIKNIAKDIGQIAEQLNIENYIVVGQDWGASVTYAMANLFPDNIDRIVTVAIPHYTFIKASPKTIFKARHFIRFRNAKSSLDYTRKNDLAYIDRLFKRWSPNWKEFSETSELIKSTFRAEGRLEAALGYYWTFFAQRKDKEVSEFNAQLPTMPHLAFAGKTDGSLSYKAFVRMEKELVPKLFSLLTHEKAGHFLHREAPDFFVNGLKEFLEREF